ATNLDYVALRQGSNTPAVQVDGIRVATDWGTTVAGCATINTSVTPAAGGSISPAGPFGIPLGGSQTFTISTNNCYTLTDVKVDGMSQGPITMYTFTNNDGADHTLNATYAANPAPTTVDLTQDPAKTGCGEKVVFTALVSPTGATGTVTFFADGNPLGPPVPVQMGFAQISVSNLSAGPHSITAQYSGDACHTPSTSNKIDHEVNPIPTTVDLSQDPAKTNCGDKVLFTAHVSPPGATGTVTFLDGPNPLGPPVPVDAAGNAQLSVSTLGVGPHSITAVYSGDACHTPSTSNKVDHEVNPIPTVVDLTQDPAKTNCGDKVLFSAHVSPPGAT